MWNALLEARPKERADLAAWYEAILEEAEALGLSIDEAADDIGVTAATLRTWMRRLAASGVWQPSHGQGPLAET